MPKCPSCNNMMETVKGEFEYKCRICHRTWTHAELLKTHWTSERRLIRIALSTQLIEHLLYGFDFSDDCFFTLPEVTNFPKTAKYVGSFTDLPSLSASFIFQDNTFDPVDEAGMIPSLILQFKTRHLFTIPEDYLEDILSELDALEWDKNDGFKMLWVLLNKLKKATGSPLSEYEEVSWESTKKKEVDNHVAKKEEETDEGS